MPTVLIVAGPNGAGKTTFVQSWFPMRGQAEGFVFLNADEIARELRAGGAKGSAADVAAGRALLDQLDLLSRSGANILVETTLSTRVYVRWISVWRQRNYRIELVYIRLPSVEASLARVAHRVSIGGHVIPEADVRRRFARSLANLQTLYKPLVDSWEVWDSRNGELTLAERKP